MAYPAAHRGARRPLHGECPVLRAWTLGLPNPVAPLVDRRL